MVARGRLARGIKLNYPESIVLISDFVPEGAREGRSVFELTSDAGKVLTRAGVMEGISEMIHEMQVEATFLALNSLRFTTQFVKEVVLRSIFLD